MKEKVTMDVFDFLYDKHLIYFLSTDGRIKNFPKKECLDTIEKYYDNLSSELKSLDTIQLRMVAEWKFDQIKKQGNLKQLKNKLINRYATPGNLYSIELGNGKVHVRLISFVRDYLMAMKLSKEENAAYIDPRIKQMLIKEFHSFDDRDETVVSIIKENSLEFAVDSSFKKYKETGVLWDIASEINDRYKRGFEIINKNEWILKVKEKKAKMEIEKKKLSINPLIFSDVDRYIYTTNNQLVTVVPNIKPKIILVNPMKFGILYNDIILGIYAQENIEIAMKEVLDFLYPGCKTLILFSLCKIGKE